jgi:hypothetical protein
MREVSNCIRDLSDRPSVLNAESVVSTVLKLLEGSSSTEDTWQTHKLKKDRDIDNYKRLNARRPSEGVRAAFKPFNKV